MVFKLPSGLSAAQLSDISFLDGLDQDDTLVLQSYFSWTGATPATYAANAGVAHKWGASTAGQGATLSYYFDSGSNWTATEEKTFLGAMALYADVANVTFVQASSEASAVNSGVVFYRYGSTTAAANGVTLSTGYYASYSETAQGAVGTKTLDVMTSAYISAQTQNAAGYGDITSLGTYGGYGVDSIVHEMGHVVGLGHAGPYDFSASAATQQYDAADTRLYSVMSYINPSNASAAFYNSYAVTGTNWGSTSDGYARAPYTPMIDDILAVQQLYGTSSGTTLNTAQTFGFNTTIAAADPIRMFYDFTVDTKPVLTIYDSAAGNKLDLSGYSANSAVNLNPGTFSSVAGLVNNIAIAYGTAVDAAIGGSGNDTFIVNADADAIDGGGGTNTVDFSSALAAYSLRKVSGQVKVTNLAIHVVDTLSNIATLQFADQTVAASSIACFVRGARILTERGEIEVEALAPGDFVVTASRDHRPVTWVGHRALNPRLHPRPLEVHPIRVRAGAFGEGLPRRDLWLSPGHAVAFAGALIPILALVNDASVAQVEVETVEYWHVELDAHDVILAESLPTESYLDQGNRAAFANAGAFIEAHPDFRPRHWSQTCLPLALQGAPVRDARAHLARRLGALGFALSSDADPHLIADGRRIEPIRLSPRRLAFVMPVPPCSLSLCSRSFTPACVCPDSEDARVLGLAVARIEIDGAVWRLDDRRLATGWRVSERAQGGAARRWTDGAAALPAGARVVLIDLAEQGRYPVSSDAVAAPGLKRA